MKILIKHDSLTQSCQHSSKLPLSLQKTRKQITNLKKPKYSLHLNTHINLLIKTKLFQNYVEWKPNVSSGLFILIWLISLFKCNSPKTNQINIFVILFFLCNIYEIFDSNQRLFLIIKKQYSLWIQKKILLIYHYIIPERMATLRFKKPLWSST